MATMKERIIAGTGAAVFFLSIIALTVVVLVTMAQERNQKKDQAAATASSGECQPLEEAGKLQCTKLAGFEPLAGVSELKTSDTEVGTGAEVTAPEQTVTVHYTGALAKDGTIFQSSKDSGQPATFALNQVIEGWQKGIIGMKEGGKRRIVIPAAQAYGSQSQPNIPANSDLVFDVELQKIGTGEAAAQPSEQPAEGGQQ